MVAQEEQQQHDGVSDGVLTTITFEWGCWGEGGGKEKEKKQSKKVRRLARLTCWNVRCIWMREKEKEKTSDGDGEDDGDNGNAHGTRNARRGRGGLVSTDAHSLGGVGCLCGVACGVVSLA